MIELDIGSTPTPPPFTPCNPHLLGPYWHPIPPYRPIPQKNLAAFDGYALRFGSYRISSVSSTLGRACATD